MSGRQAIAAARSSGVIEAQLAAGLAERALTWARFWRDRPVRIALARDVSRDMMRDSALRYRRHVETLQRQIGAGL